jgi:purine nucleosidase
MVGLDVTRQMVLAPHETTRLQHAGAPQARWIQDALRFYIEFHKQQEGMDGCIVNDVLPIAALLKPAALTFEEQHLVVDLDDGEHRGHTRIDPHGPRVKVATHVDVAMVRPLLSERVFRWAVHQGATPIVSQEAGV